MKNRLLFFDVETPNNKNDKICQLGLIVEENGEIIYINEFLINPETSFHFINTKLHGISASTVFDKSTFPEIWKEIGYYFKTSLLVGFNASFDLNVLKKTLKYYNIDFDNYDYLDTYYKSMEQLTLEKYKLNLVCEHLGYELEQHHNAFEDTKACYFIYKAFENQNLWSDYDINTLMEPVKETTHFNTTLSETTKVLNKFKELLEVILADENVDVNELIYLKEWMDNHQELAGNFPFDDIYSNINNIFYDNQITYEEMIQITKKLYKFIHPDVDSFEITILDFKDKNICLTGDFLYGSKEKVEQLVIENGGFINDNVIKKTDYVIIGELGSAAWAFGNFGSKVKKAMELQSKGHHIQVVHEKDINFN